MKKKILMGLAAAFAALTAQAQQAWKNTSLSFHERAKSLVAAMTLDEKIGQVGHQTAEISRLGLKGYNYWSEALHGVARSGLATSFPESKAMSATWDLPLIFDCASATSDEDLNCGDTFQKFCKEAIQKGLLTEAELDTALVRVLEARFSVGEFDSRSEVKWQQTPDSMLNCQKHKDLALKAARESIVLLKNAAPSNLTQQGETAPLLPLKKDQTVCVVGPFARTVTLGGYSGSPADLTTPARRHCPEDGRQQQRRPHGV